MRRVLLTGFATLSMIAAVAHAAIASPVAMASDLTGQPEIRAAAGGPWHPLLLCARLSPGDTVRCGTGATVTIMMFTNGSRYKIAAHGHGVVAPTSVTGGQAVAGIGGPSVQVASAMTGSRLDAFLTRAGRLHERITKDFPGYFIAGTRHFDFLPLDDAVSYNFTIFDRSNDVLWNGHAMDTSVDCPADQPDFLTNRAYIWTLTGIGADGKAVPGTRWGFITFLSQDDADTMNSQAAKLQAEIAAHPADATTNLLILADLYRSYGVTNNVFETLERLNGKPGIPELVAQRYREAGPFAVLLAGNIAQTAPGN